MVHILCVLIVPLSDRILTPIENWPTGHFSIIEYWPAPWKIDPSSVTYLLLLISMLWHRQAIFESKGDKLSSSAESRIRTQGVYETQSSADWMPADKPTELSRIKLKTWTRQPVPMISKHSAHLTPLPFGIRTWLWRYTYLLLLISMLWHRQAIFESKGDKLSSSAESRIRTQGVYETQSSADCDPTIIHRAWVNIP